MLLDPPLAGIITTLIFKNYIIDLPPSITIFCPTIYMLLSEHKKIITSCKSFGDAIRFMGILINFLTNFLS